MKTRTLALLLLISACDEDPTQPLVDSGPPSVDSTVPDTTQKVEVSNAKVADSLRKWQQLSKATPGSYWYEEENCAPNKKAGASSTIQVDQAGSRVAGTRSFERTQCIENVNRYENLDNGSAPTFERLHELCDALLKTRSDTRFSTDAQGVIKTCFVPDRPSCKDNCGSGFALRGWGFGTAPKPDAGFYSEQPSSSCDLEAEIWLRAGSTPVDCGVLPAGSSASTLAAAQKCVLDSQAAHRPFRLRIAWQGVDNLLSDGFAGDSAHASLIHYGSDRSVGESITAELCESLEVAPDCTPGNGTLCLRCKGQLESSQDCTTPRPDGECHQVGDYEAGKEGSYRPCCGGLREVFQQREVDGASGKECVDLPLRVSSCIEGRCGDGRCEGPESNPCGGCTLDCK